MCHVVYHDYCGFSVIRCVKCVMIMVCHEYGVIVYHDYRVFDIVL